MSTVFIIEEQEQEARPEWTPMLEAQEQLGLSRYLFKQLRKKYQLRTKKTFDKRVRLIDLVEAKRCLRKELVSS